MRSVSVKIPSSTGLTMAATLDLPDAQPEAFALFAHCFTCNRFAPAASRISKQLASSSIACLRFDFPGLGQSEGQFENTSFSENVEDLKAAYRWLEQNYEAPKLTIGHSLGGAATLCASSHMPAVKAVATVGAPFDPAHAVLQFADKIPDIDAQGVMTMQLAGRPITMSRHYLEDLAETNPELYIPTLRKPLLILHSPVDQTVGIDNAQNIFRLARYPKSLVSLDRADHLMTRPGVAQQAAKLIEQWAKQYIAAPEGPHNHLPEGQAVAVTRSSSKFMTVTNAGDHDFISDREASLGGGQRLGPTPTDLLISACATAASQAIRAHAQAERIRGFEEVEVHASLSGTAGTDPTEAQSDTKNEASETITRTITLRGDLTDAQRADLIAAASSNPIDKLLAHPIIDTAHA